MKRARLWALLLLLLAGLAWPATAFAQDSRESEELVVMETSVGHIVLALYPEVAPRHVEQILNLVRLGVYDGTRFYRIDPGFIVQLSSWSERRVPVTPDQRAAVRPLPLEVGPAYHRRRALTMTRDLERETAETSFNILLADAPHLDRQYTVFGYVKHGWEVVRAMERLARTQASFTPIEVVKAEVVPAAKLDLARLRLAPADGRPKNRKPHWATFGNPWNPTPNAGHLSPELEDAGGDAIATGLLGLILVCGVAVFLVARKTSKWIASLGLMTMLLAFLALFRSLGPAAPLNPALASALYLGQFVVLFLVTQFDPPIEQPEEPRSLAGARRSGTPTA